MANDKEWLSRAECSALRGIAILGIMLHNYFHWLSMAVKENEYTFSAHNNARLWYEIQHPTEYLPVHLLSYFGHYGVPVFLFLSGFGLVMKYETDATIDLHRSVYRFLRYNYLKLFRIMIVGLVLFTMVDYMTPGPHHYHVPDLLGLLTMTVNLFPAPDQAIWPGPFWFFGLMMQLYLVYVLLLYRRHWSIAALLVAVCWLLQELWLGDAEALNRLRYNCIGGMLPFVAGVVCARLGRQYPPTSVGRWHWLAVAVAAVVLTFALCQNAHTWLWAPLAVVVATVGMVKLTPQPLLGWLIWTGSISAAMFVVHPTLRKLFIPISRWGDIYAGLILYVTGVFVVSWMLSLVINKMSKPRL